MSCRYWRIAGRDFVRTGVEGRKNVANFVIGLCSGECVQMAEITLLSRMLLVYLAPPLIDELPLSLLEGNMSRAFPGIEAQ